MWKEIAPAFKTMLALTILLGVLYPLATTGLAQLLFPEAANGSLLMKDGRVVGSSLIGQGFSKPEYFHGRPSAAGNGYDPTSSGGSNYGPTNQKLIERVQADIEKFRRENPEYSGPIPADLLTASGSGLDPDISPASALAQAPRVAKARRLPVETIREAIARSTESPLLGFVGEPRVNVLRLNLALDQQLRAGR